MMLGAAVRDAMVGTRLAMRGVGAPVAGAVRAAAMARMLARRGLGRGRAGDLLLILDGRGLGG